MTLKKNLLQKTNYNLHVHSDNDFTLFADDPDRIHKSQSRKWVGAMADSSFTIRQISPHIPMSFCMGLHHKHYQENLAFQGRHNLPINNYIYIL